MFGITNKGMFVPLLLLAMTATSSAQELILPSYVNPPGRGFVVSYSVPEGSIVTWANEFPVGASRPFVATDESGNKALVFIDSCQGDYRFVFVTQTPVAGADKLTVKSGTVRVGAPLPIPGPIPGTPTPAPDPISTNVTKATFIYEKDKTSPSSSLLVKMNKLNREKNILATLFDIDTTNGLGQIPEMYRKEVEAATNQTPCLVLSNDSGVIKVLKSEKEILEWE